MKNKNISLIGCGWLGVELDQALKNLGFSVIGTTSGKNPSSYLTLNLEEKAIVPDVILQADVLVYMIPPLELDLVKNFFDQLNAHQKIIFISSTSVYGKHSGAVDEATSLNIKTSSSPLLVSTEDYLKSRFTKLSILRPGGLYGKKRHPIYFLQGKTGLKTGNELLHLGHLDDVIKAIKAVIDKDVWNETINLVSDLRIKKKDYYTSMAEKLNLPKPQYEDLQASMETNISNEKSKKLLGISYRNPSEFYTSSV